jgi:hypothetical protein
LEVSKPLIAPISAPTCPVKVEIPILLTAPLLVNNTKSTKVPRLRTCAKNKFWKVKKPKKTK